MSFTSQGRDIAVRTNPKSGKLRRIWDTDGPNNGNPQFDDTANHAVYLCVFCHRGKYWADTAGTFGSLVYTLPTDPKAVPAKFVAYANDGLAPLVTAGLIVGPKAYATRTVDRMDCLVQYQTPDKRPQQIRPTLPVT